MMILPRSAWGAQPPKSVTAMTRPDGWVVHWVGGTNMPIVPTLGQSTATMFALQTAAFAGLHGDHYVDFEYNFAVDPVGRIFEGRGWTVQSGANGSTNYNAHGWSVVYLAGPGTPLTAAARQGLLWLTQEGARRNGAVSYVRPHSSLPAVSTACPGPELTEYCSYLNAHLHDPQQPVRPKPVPKPKVKIMYAPALTIAAVLQKTPSSPASAGVAPDGAVFVWDAELGYHGGANGKAYFKGKQAAQLVWPNAAEKAAGKRYTIVAADDPRHRFAYPE